MSKRQPRPNRLSKRERRTMVALVDANKRLGAELLRRERKYRELVEANANLGVERDAADVLLGEAMDRLLELERA